MLKQCTYPKSYLISDDWYSFCLCAILILCMSYCTSSPVVMYQNWKQCSAVPVSLMPEFGMSLSILAMRRCFISPFLSPSWLHSFVLVMFLSDQVM